MKLLREMVGKGVVLRSTIGKTVSAKGMVHVLAKLYGANYKLQDVTPYVRALNQALQSVQTEDQAAQVWQRLQSELSHTRKRSLPDE